LAFCVLDPWPVELKICLQQCWFFYACLFVLELGADAEKQTKWLTDGRTDKQTLKVVHQIFHTFTKRGDY